MTKIEKITCPECKSKVIPEEELVIGSILSCPSCTLDLKIIGLKPLTVVVDNSWEEDDFRPKLKPVKNPEINKSQKEDFNY